MDRSLNNHTPDLSKAESALQDRILAGHSAVLSQVEYFRANFGLAESKWKKDGTRVTEVDENISRELFIPLQKAFPDDDFFSMATTMARLDTNNGDYLMEVKEHFQMQCLLSLVFELIDNTEMKCLEYRYELS